MMSQTPKLQFECAKAIKQKQMEKIIFYKYRWDAKLLLLSVFVWTQWEEVPLIILTPTNFGTYKKKKKRKTVLQAFQEMFVCFLF